MIGGAEGDRTPDLMTASAISSAASGYGFYDLPTFVTGCSRQRVHLLLPIQATFAVVLSQDCRNSGLCSLAHSAEATCTSLDHCLISLEWVAADRISPVRSRALGAPVHGNQFDHAAFPIGGALAHRGATAMAIHDVSLIKSAD